MGRVIASASETPTAKTPSATPCASARERTSASAEIVRLRTSTSPSELSSIAARTVRATLVSALPPATLIRPMATPARENASAKVRSSAVMLTSWLMLSVGFASTRARVTPAVSARTSTTPTPTSPTVLPSPRAFASLLASALIVRLVAVTLAPEPSSASTFALLVASTPAPPTLMKPPEAAFAKASARRPMRLPKASTFWRASIVTALPAIVVSLPVAARTEPPTVASEIITPTPAAPIETPNASASAEAFRAAEKVTLPVALIRALLSVKLSTVLPTLAVALPAATAAKPPASAVALADASSSANAVTVIVPALSVPPPTARVKPPTCASARLAPTPTTPPATPAVSASASLWANALMVIVPASTKAPLRTPPVTCAADIASAPAPVPPTRPPDEALAVAVTSPTLKSPSALMLCRAITERVPLSTTLAPELMVALTAGSTFAVASDAPTATPPTLKPKASASASDADEASTVRSATLMVAAKIWALTDPPINALTIGAVTPMRPPDPAVADPIAA